MIVIISEPSSAPMAEPVPPNRLAPPITTAAIACSMRLEPAVAVTLLSAQILSIDPLAGNLLELDAIAAVVIGGASLFGGTGSAIGALLGSLMITIIQNGANLIGVNSFWQGTVTGIVILIAVLVDRITKARR